MHNVTYKCNNHKILSQKEEYDLFKKYNETTDKKVKMDIRNTIIEHNLKFALGCAITYMQRWKQVNPDDLKGYATLGLFKAFDKFDYTNGVKFITYASWWIKCTINRSAEENECLIRYPSSIHKKLYAYYISHKDDDSSNDLESLEYNSICNNISSSPSLDQNIGDADKGTLGDTITDGTTPEDDIFTNDSINKMFSVLTKMEKDIIIGIYGFDDGNRKTISELADEFQVSKETIRNIKNKALKKMKSYSKDTKVIL